jgi:hypothetical protein
MLEIAPSKLSTTPVLFALFAIVFATIWLQTYFSSSILSKIPGPFLARFTDFWRYLDVSKGNHHNTLLRLHSEHGKYVRIGPNTVSIADPELIDPIYGVNAGFYKVRHTQNLDFNA